MKVYIDTNIVVADAVEGHIHNANAAALFQLIDEHQWTPVISAHGMTDIYSVLTRTPYQPRISPAEAWQIIQENILQSFEVESPTTNEYSRVLQDCAAQGWAGGLVHDALHIQTARKAKCGRIYTFNVVHFRKLAPDLHDRIMAP